jgi:gluconolactonase
MRDSMFSIYSVQPAAADLDHPECVNFGPDGYAYAGGEAGQLFRFKADESKIIVANTGGGIGGLCLDGNNNVYECNYGTPVVHKISPQGEVTVYSSGTEQYPAIYPNYPVFDSKGNLYYSDSGDFYKPSGRIFVVRPDGTTENLFGGHLHFPNGLAIDAEENYLYAIQSSASNILRFPLTSAGLGEPDIYASLPGTVPDGLAFAESGNLYVSCYAPDVIYRITPERVTETVICDTLADRVNRPTNIAFEPGTTRLYFANLGGFTINCIDVNEKGQSLKYPKLQEYPKGANL